MATIIRDDNLTKVAESVKVDDKSRVHIPKVLIREGITYHIYTNSFGQIILDPQVTIPASEVWLFKNPEAIALVQKGLVEAAQGKVSKVDLNTL